jgi:prevent-host-death family protein
MKEVGAFEAKNRLGALLDLVERGEEVIITRHGRPAAKLVPATPRADRAQARAAAERIRARAAAQKCKITVDEIKAYRDEGRA